MTDIYSTQKEEEFFVLMVHGSTTDPSYAKYPWLGINQTNDPLYPGSSPIGKYTTPEKAEEALKKIKNLVTTPEGVKYSIKQLTSYEISKFIKLQLNLFLNDIRNQNHQGKYNDMFVDGVVDQKVANIYKSFKSDTLYTTGVSPYSRFFYNKYPELFKRIEKQSAIIDFFKIFVYLYRICLYFNNNGFECPTILFS